MSGEDRRLAAVDRLFNGDPYDDLLRQKLQFDTASGFDIDSAIRKGRVTDWNPKLMPHQVDLVRWMVTGGRRGLFAKFGLGKSIIQLEAACAVIEHTGRPALIVCPLGVRQEFVRDAVEVLGIDRPIFVRRDSELDSAMESWTGQVFLTNYESVRDGKLTPSRFEAISLDEGAVLRSLGTKTTDVFRTACRDVPYRFVATATPAPNEYDELLNYADFLGIMDKGQALTRFFKRNSTQAGDLTLMSHRAEEFWAWMATWSVFIDTPSDLGHPDDGYILPEIDVRWHEVTADALENLTFESRGQGVLVADGKLGVVGASKVKRSTMTDRIAKAVELVNEAPGDHFILWHHTEPERRAIKTALPDAVEVYGSLNLEERERRVIEFSDGGSRLLATKPVLSGSGCNFQRHCHRAVFVGVDFKFADFIQSIHRIHRFGQPERVRIDIIHADTERQVVATLKRRWAQHEELTAHMTELIREHGLASGALAERLARSIGTERVAAAGEGWEIVHDDTVRETRRMDDNSVDLIITSPPYGTQYEYVAAVEDFGHNDNNASFWAQMNHLTTELYRVLKPGRLVVFHTKDRVVFGNRTGEGVATIEPFGAQSIQHMIDHGFLFTREVALSTDVVRENNQTYRLSWSEVVKDSTKLGGGVAEKILVFRKPHTDKSKGYGDDPVVHTKDDYTLGNWQIDAAPVWRSSGDRFITPHELEGLPVDQILRLFEHACRTRIYDYEAHIQIADDFAARDRLPKTFALFDLHPQGSADQDLAAGDVWTNVNRMRGLNTMQSQRGAELHVCPFPFDVVDRVIRLYSNPGDLVFDPFGGLGTTVVRALHHGRRGKCTELNPAYWADAVAYAQAAERKSAHNMPTLFDLLDQASADDLEAAS